MFEFMYAKRIEKEDVMEIVEKYKDNYYLSITYKPNGTLDIFIGSKRAESEVDNADSNWYTRRIVWCDKEK